MVCHQAAVVGAGVTVADLPAYAAHNDLGTAALLAAMHEAGRRPAGAGLVDGRLRRGPLRLRRRTATRCPAAAEHGRARRRRLREPLPDLRPPRSAGRWSTRTPGSTRAAPTPPASSPRSTTPRPGCGRPDAAAVALRYHNVYGPGMPRDTPYSGVAAMFRSSLERGEAPQVFEDGGQMRDFVHVDDVARANLAALRAVVRRRARLACRVQRRVRPPGRGSWTSPGWWPGGPGSDRCPEVTGGYRLGDVRHIVASPGAGDRRAGLHGRDCCRRTACRTFATAPLRD